MEKFIATFQRDYLFTKLWAVSTIGVLGFIWLISEINQKIEIKHIPKDIVGEYLSLGLQVLLIGIGLTPIVLSINYLTTIKKRKILDKRLKIKQKYKVEFAKETDLKEVASFGRSLVGDSHIDLETLEVRYKINPQIVTCLFKETENISSHTLIGYYILYPLTSEAYDGIHRTDIINGRDIKEEHICSSFLDATVLYIGMAGGEAGHATGFVIEEMIEQISHILHSKKLKAVCTRGATDEGVKAVNNFGFQKLSEPSEISCILISNETLSNERIKRHLAYR